nr:hypothetical protein [Tanacetum cinerariifolium]
MENTMLELVKICKEKELLCMHDNVDDLIEIAPILSTKEPEYSPSMGYEHHNTTPETKSDEIIKSGVEELVPILSENEDFEDIEYIEASLPDPEIVNVEEENDVNVEEEEVDLEDVFQIQDIVLREKLLSINLLIDNIKSLNDNPAPDHVLNSSVLTPISEESDNFLLDNFLPEIETFCNHTKETRSGNTTTHADGSLLEYDSFYFEIEPNQERLINVLKNDISDNSTRDIRFLEALLIDDSIPFPNNESPESNFDNPSFLRPPSKPPDEEFDFKLDSEEEILVMINDKDEFDDVYSFMFVICSKMFLSFFSAESDYTIFNPGISV